MIRTDSLKLLSLAVSLLVAGPAVLAQALAPQPTKSPAAARDAQASSPVLTPKQDDSPKDSGPRRSRAVSGGVAAALAAAGPKYTPPPPPKPAPTPEAERPDMREIDKPKNTIVRLPDYIVQEKKPAVFRERDVSTEKGLTDIAVRRYISDLDQALNRFTLPLFGSSYKARAMMMYEEDERLRNMADLKGAADGASKSDPAAGAYIRREAQETFMRTSDFGWNGGGPK